MTTNGISLLQEALQAGPVVEVLTLQDAITGGIFLFVLGTLGGWLLNDIARKYQAWLTER
jgi:hypothetical protein